MNPRLVATGIRELLPMDRSGEASCHISAIIRSLCLDLGHFEDDSDATPEQREKRQTRMELGSAFEDAVEDALAERYVRSDPGRYCRIGELTKDGLIGTPDLVDVTDWAVIEIKLTWMSSRHGVDSDKFWKYWTQLKAYCHMAETAVGRIHVCHLNGNYRDDRDPTYNVWEDTFTKRELEDNWRLLLTQQRALAGGGKARVSKWRQGGIA